MPILCDSYLLELEEYGVRRSPKTGPVALPSLDGNPNQEVTPDRKSQGCIAAVKIDFGCFCN